MQTVLVTDTHQSLGFNLLKAFLHEGLNVVAAPTDKHEEGARKNPYDGFKKKNFAAVPWNRSSPLSSKNLVLLSRQKFSDLDAAFILLPPLPPAAPFSELKYLDVETVLDFWLKGSILLARDLLAYFAARRGGSLTFVSLSLPKTEAPSLLDDVCRETMLVVWEGLVKDARPAGVNSNVFLSRAADTKAYAGFIARTAVEKCNKVTGKLFYFQWK